MYIYHSLVNLYQRLVSIDYSHVYKYNCQYTIDTCAILIPYFVQSLVDLGWRGEGGASPPENLGVYVFDAILGGGCAMSRTYSYS